MYWTRLRRTLAWILALCFIGLTIPFLLTAQNADKPDSEGVIGNTAALVSLTFNGLSHFSEAQVLQVSALHVGQIVGKDDFKAAADRLAESGGFTNVAYKFRSGPSGVTLEFDLTETTQLLPCLFDNFVWFSNDEINQAVAQSVPLYTDGTIPLDQPTIGKVRSVLVALLQLKSITAEVLQVAQPGAAGKLASMSYRVANVPMPVTMVTFPGADASRMADLQGAAFGLIGQDYSAYYTAQFANSSLGRFYRHRGYFRVHFGSPQGKLNGAAAGPPYNVAVTIPIEEGDAYTWGGETWTGNQAMASDDLDHMLAMPADQIADGDKLDAGLAAIHRAYSMHGYIDAMVRQTQNFDDSAHVMTSEFMLEEGPQYHMGTVTFAGLPDSVAKKLASEWQLKPGDVYDDTYFETFVKKASWPKPAGKANLQINPTLKRNLPSATVDVTYTVIVH